MKLATTTGDFLSYIGSQAEALTHIRKAGFLYADYAFRQDYQTATGVFAQDWRHYLNEIAAHTEKTGIRLVQAHAPMGAPLTDGGALLEATLRCVDACGIWQIPNLVVHSGYAPGLSKEETFLRNRDFFLPILKRAERYGLNILVENFNRMSREDTYWIDNAPDLLTMIQTVDHPLFHAIWDTGHGNMRDMPQDESLRLLGSHVRAVHIQDNMGDFDTHLVPFLGSLNLDSVMHGLLEIGYPGYFTFEVGRFFTPAEKRQPYAGDQRLVSAPLELRDAFEAYLYALGRIVLEKYGCFEE